MSNPQENNLPGRWANHRDPLVAISLVPMGLSLDLPGQLFDLFSLLNNVKRKDIDVHLVQLITDLVGQHG